MIPTIFLGLLLQVAPAAPVALHVRPANAANPALYERFLSEILFATGFSQDQALVHGSDSLPSGTPTDAAVYGVAASTWLNKPEIERIIFNARIGNVVDFVMETRARNNETAESLADNLHGYLIPLRAFNDGPAVVVESIRNAQVTTSGNTVRLSMTFTPEALDRIRNNEASAALLKWKFVPDDRERWLRTPDIFDALQIASGSRVADVGAGDGYLSVRLARRVGAGGKVLAVDINKRILDELNWRAKSAALSQVETVLGEIDDPKLPLNSLDAVLMVNSYHEMPEHQKINAHIFRALKPGGRFVLVEPFSEATRSLPRDEQEKKHLIASDLVREDLKQSGFEILRRDDDFIRNGDYRQWIIVSRRP